jgi:hypothetical protein
MDDGLPKTYRIEEINRLNGFFTLYAVPWALIGLVSIEFKSRQLTGFLFALAFLVNLLLFIYFSGKLNSGEPQPAFSMPQYVLIKNTQQALTRIYMLVGFAAAFILVLFIFVLKRPVYLTPLFLIITGFLFVIHRWYYQIQGEQWIAPAFFLMALILIILGDHFINWYSWGGFSGATIIWYACLDRHRMVNDWLQNEGQEPESKDEEIE